MSNLFSSIFAGAKDSITSPLKVGKDLVKGDFSGAFKDLKHMPGNQERANSDILGSVGIRGKVGQNPVIIPATIFGGIFAAGAAGVGGAGAAAGSGGAAGGVAGTGASAGAGGVGVGAYMAPTTAGGVASSMPATSSLLSMGHAGVGAAGSTAGASSFTPAMLTQAGAAASGGTYGAASAPMASTALGSVPASTSGGVASATGSSVDYNQLARTLQSVQKSDQQQTQAPSVQFAPAARGSFNFDRKSFENPLLTKAYSDLYYAPATR